MGNAKVERAKLSPGFIPMGMKEYGGIVYIASYNPDTLECEIGSFPSPERDITGSNDIENQTGLVDGLFNNSEFNKPIEKVNGEYRPEERTSKLQKLNEEEVLQLNPGDKFITTYEVKPGTGTGVPVDNNNFNDYFSFTESDKKVFQINFFKIDSSNNLVKLEESEIKSIVHRTGIEEDEFMYYTQTSSGSIAVEVELNSIDYFTTAMRELSRKSETNKKIRIEAVGSSESDVDFEGVRVELKSVSEDNTSTSETFHVAKTSGDKVSVTVDQLKQNDEVTCEITPYSKYGYEPTLAQMLSLKIGQGSSGTGVTDIFKWKVDEVNKRLELDFDFKLDTENQIKMYLEFYDPWSNVSTIRSITSPSIYGSMRLVIPLLQEAKNTIFDVYPGANPLDPNKQLGGIRFDKVTPNVNTTITANLVNTSTYGVDLIRTDNSLKLNHFYIVRICGYEEFEEDGQIVRNFTDVYKALYTNTIYNDVYEQQRNLSIDDPNFTGDFTKVPYPLNKIGYRASLITPSNLITNREATIFTPPKDDKWTNIPQEQTIYPFSINKRVFTSDGYMRANTKYHVGRNYSIGLNRPDNYIFGTLKPNTLRITNTAGSVDVTEKITDSDMGTPTLAMGSIGKLHIPNMNTGSNSYDIKLDVTTNRGVEASYVYDQFSGGTTRVYFSDLLYKKDNTTVYPYVCGSDSAQATLSVWRGLWGANACSSSSHGISSNVKDHTTGENVEYKSIGKDKKISDWVGTINFLNEGARFNSQFFTSFERMDQTHMTSANSALSFMRLRLLFVQRGGTSDIVSFPIDLSNTNLNSAVKNFLDQFYFDRPSGSSVLNQGYYVNPDSIMAYSTNNLTTIDGLTLDVISAWDQPAIKTYVFDAILKSLSNSYVSFDLTNINTLIQNSINKGVGNVVESGLFPSDNEFIPFIDSVKDHGEIITPLLLDKDPIILRLESDQDAINLFRNSKTKYEAARNAQTTLPDTTIYTTVPNPDSNLRLFMTYFTYDTIAGQLQLTGAAKRLESYMIDKPGDSWKNTTAIKTYDVIDVKLRVT